MLQGKLFRQLERSSFQCLQYLRISNHSPIVDIALSGGVPSGVFTLNDLLDTCKIDLICQSRFPCPHGAEFVAPLPLHSRCGISIVFQQWVTSYESLDIYNDISTSIVDGFVVGLTNACWRLHWHDSTTRQVCSANAFSSQLNKLPSEIDHNRCPYAHWYSIN
jgi:hypothetical protein